MTAPWAVPDGLPPGRLIVPDPRYAERSPVPGPAGPVLWITDQPQVEPGPLWARLLSGHPTTGLWPLLLTTLVVPDMAGAREDIREVIRRSNPPGRPWLTGELAPAAASDAGEPGAGKPEAGEPAAGELLARGWDLTTGQGEEGIDFGEDAIPAVPFRSWPGLAAPGHGGDPDARAAEIVTAPGGVRQLTGRDDPPHLGLVPAPDGAGAITAAGWISRAGPAAEIASVIRSWQERFGARLCSLGMNTLGVSVAWPPDTAGHAQRVAAEHFAFCAGLADFASFGEYAGGLIGAPAWTFWWD